MNIVNRIVSRLEDAGEGTPGGPASGRAPAPARARLSLERVQQIRQGAEDAALAVALGRIGTDNNPYPVGTRQHVLWTTSFHAKLMEFETEAFAPAPAHPGAWMLAGGTPA